MIERFHRRVNGAPPEGRPYNLIAGGMIAFLLSATCGEASGPKIDLKGLPPGPAGVDLSALKRIPVQDNGRVKPFDTFAREQLRLATGKPVPAGEEPLLTLLRLMASPGEAAKADLLEFQYGPAQERLGMEKTERHHSVDELMDDPKFRDEVRRVLEKRKADEDLEKVENEVWLLFSRAQQFNALLAGSLLRLVPDREHTHDPWSTPDEAAGGGGHVKAPAVKPAYDALLKATAVADAAGFAKAAGELTAALRETGSHAVVEPVRIDREVAYNDLQPLRKAGHLAFAAFFLFLFSILLRGRVLFALAMLALAAGTVLHGWGLTLRILVGDRAPNSNLYESMIVMAFSVLFFTLVFEAVWRIRWLGLAASLIGASILLMAHNLPIQFGDESIVNVAPVLKSYWMSIHVPMMLTGYALAAIALGVAHVWLGMWLVNPAKTALLDRLDHVHYRVIQVSVVALAAGLLLGAAWANESWGRYWGWDNKETWALISLLGYVAVLHARFVRQVAGFGTSVAGLFCFINVVMTYYGVNFVLGSKNHSYVSGKGGDFWHDNWWLVVYVAAETALAVAAWLVARARRGPPTPAAGAPAALPASSHGAGGEVPA